MDRYPIRRQIRDLESQLQALGESLALLPADQRALAGADLELVRAALGRLLPPVAQAPGKPAAQVQPALDRSAGDEADGEDSVVWTANRTTRLYAINAALSLALTPAQVAQVVVAQALPAVFADAGVILLSSDETTFRPVNEAGALAPAAAASLLADSSPLAEAARSVQPLWIESREELLARYDAWNASEWSDSAAMAAVPLVTQGRVLGVMALRFDSPRTFTIADRAFMLVLAQQCAAALERVELYEQVRQAATLQERHRLARDLHDSVSQALYAIVLSATAGRANVEKDAARVARALENVQSLAGAAQADLRALLFDLRADSFSQTGLVDALLERAQFVGLRHGLTVRTELCAEPDLTMPCKEAIYGIAREALHNAAKHARAQQIDMTLAQLDRELVLEIKDDGSGFELSQPRPHHYGLQSMRERAAELGADLKIETAPGQGTRVVVVVRTPALVVSGESSPRCD